MVAGQEATSNYILPYRTQTRMLQIMQLPQVPGGDSTLVRSPGGWVGTRPFPNWSRLDGKPSVFPSSIGLVQGLQGALDGKMNIGSSIAYGSLTGIPTAFNPAPHTHVISDVTGLQAALNGKQAAGAYITTETDPTVPVHVKSITTANIASWNAQADWSQTNTASADFIKNKPTITGPQSYFNVAGSIPRPGKVLVDRIAVTSGTMTINISSAGFTSTAGMIIRADVERAGTANIDAVTCKVRSFTATQVVIDFYQPVTIVLGGLGMQLLNTYANTWVHLRVEGN